MLNEVMQERKTGLKFVLDPRTKILLVFIGSIVLITGSPIGPMLIIRPVFALVPLILFFINGKYKTVAKFSLIYGIAYLMEIYLIPITGGLLGFLIVALSGILSRFIPSLALGYYLVSTTTVSEFVASMERMHIPQCIVIPFAVMFRFFPTVREESRAIKDAMRMRGIGFSGIFKHPLTMLEYCLVPMMMSTVKIGEELSAAALTRGLGNPIKRTNICKIGFGIQDILFSSLSIAAFIGFLYS